MVGCQSAPRLPDSGGTINFLFFEILKINDLSWLSIIREYYCIVH